MTQNRKHVYRQGDIVNIVTPRLFVRCGYPMDADEVQKSYDWNKENELVKHIRCLYGVNMDNNMGGILRQIAVQQCKQNNFGGNNRTIHEVDSDASLVGVEWRVTSVRKVATGTRIPGYGGNWSGDDYEPPIFDLDRYYTLLSLYNWNGILGQVMIVSDHVELIKAAPKPKKGKVK